MTLADKITEDKEKVYSEIEEELNELFIEIGLDGNGYVKGTAWLKELIMIGVQNPEDLKKDWFEIIGQKNGVTRELVRFSTHKAAADHWKPNTKVIMEKHFGAPFEYKFLYVKPNQIEFVTLLYTKFREKYKLSD